MPLVTPVPHQDDVTPISARRGRVWRAPIAPTAYRGRVWRTPVAPRAQRGRVWRSPVVPEVVGRHLDDLDVVSPWPAARRGRVWRNATGAAERPSLAAVIVMLVVTAVIAAGAGAFARLDDFDTAAPAVELVDQVATTAGDGVSIGAVAEQTGVTTLWELGLTGAGVNVAVIDTGVAAVPGLRDAVIAAVDVSAEQHDPARMFVDGNGHGTHTAGIIAGRDAATGFRGVAPDAGIVSVKVASRDGSVTPSSVVTGIDWVVAHADELDIRVISLALDTNDQSDYRTSALAAAVERAWAAGIVVVTAAGNDGQAEAGLSLPASDPYVIAVAGLDDDGSVPGWASRGDDTRRPDVAVPGAHILSLRAPGSVADTDHPEGYVDDELFKGTGSSQSTAFVAGTVALLRQAHPAWTPDQVKAALVRTTAPVAGDIDVVGNGLVRADLAIDADVSAAVQSYPAAAETTPVTRTSGTAALAPAGSAWAGSAWAGSAWAGSAWAGSAWAGSAWAGSAWAGSAWAGSAWAGSAWAGSAWAGSAWAGSAWAGSAWAGSAWAGSAWAGSAWAGSAWAGSAWAGSAWAGSAWAGSAWAGSAWAGSAWAGSAWAGSAWAGSAWAGSAWAGSAWAGSAWA